MFTKILYRPALAIVISIILLFLGGLGYVTLPTARADLDRSSHPGVSGSDSASLRASPAKPFAPAKPSDSCACCSLLVGHVTSHLTRADDVPAPSTGGSQAHPRC